jgi:hypothetical protein
VSVNVCCSTDSNKHCTQPPFVVVVKCLGLETLHDSYVGRWAEWGGVGGGEVYGPPTVVHECQYWCNFDFVVSLM